MPAVESWPAATLAAADNSPDASGGGFSGQSSAADGDDFDRVMQATLAAHPRKPADKAATQTARPPAPENKLFSTSPSAVTDPQSNTSTDSGKVKTASRRAADNADKSPSATEVPGQVAADAATPLVPPPPPWLAPGALAAQMSDLTAENTTPGKTETVQTNGSQTSNPLVSAISLAAIKLAASQPEAGQPGTSPAKAAKTKASQPAANQTEADETEADETGEVALKVAALKPVTEAEIAPVAASTEKPAQTLPAKTDSPAGLAEKADAAGENGLLKTAPATTQTDAALPAQLELPADQQVTVLNFDRASHVETETAAENAGTGVAINVSQMKNPQKTNKVAGPDVKVLPVGESGGVQEKNLPTPLLVTPVRNTENHDTDQGSAFANGNDPAATADNSQALNVVNLPSLSDARMRAVDRANDMISLHAMRLVESKLDTLSVVIKPSVGTELSLELRQRPDGVEAHATLTRGDSQILSEHWPELQQRLELRGIKLAPLGNELDFSSGGSPQFQQSPQSSPEELAQQASAFAEFAANPAGGATSRVVAVHDGWESWA